MPEVTEPDTPVELEYRAQRRRYWLAAFVVLFVVATFLYWRIVPQPAEEYAAIQEHFKYGSIGADNAERGIPFHLWQALPEMFPDYLPDKGRSGRGYESFGFIQEPGKDRPIGFSKRRVLGLELVGMNCAICHAGVVRASPESARQVVLGMPSNTVNLQAYFRFLFACAGDGRFTVDNVMAHIRKKANLDWYECLAYRSAIPKFREAALAQKEKLKYWDDPQHAAPFGPGRVDTFNPYKVLFFDMQPGLAVGTADFPSLWNQRRREGMNLHWDGNNDSVYERNISAAIGAGVVAPSESRSVRSSLDEPSMARIADWILDLRPPRFPESRMNPDLLPLGKTVFNDHCARCHALGSGCVGKVTSWDDKKLRTDRNRLDSFPAEMVQRMNSWGKGYPWQFSHFHKTDGYANSPLDGIWLRAPYLHNGSVPNLHALLWPKERPTCFRRGNDVYDWKNVGFDSETKSADGTEFFLFDTRRKGNSNAGHLYGTDLPENKKKALLEYLKTL